MGCKEFITSIESTIMYFIHVQIDGKGRYELLGSDGYLVNRYLYAIFFDTKEKAQARIESLKEQNPTCNFKIIKK